MSLVSGRWIYSRRAKRYFTMVDGITLLQARAKRDGTLDTRYSVLDWRHLDSQTTARMHRILRKHWKLCLARLDN